MTFIRFANIFRDYQVFSLQDIKKVFPNFSRLQLTRWQNKGYIKKIINKYYVFSDLEINESTLFLMANRIYSPSYVSSEMALAYYGLIPESAYAITSSTTKHTYRFTTPWGTFIYRQIKPSIMFGYNLVSIKNQRFKIAEPEKAILDYLYLTPDLKNENDFFEFRLNKDLFLEKIDIQKIKQYLKIFNNKSLSDRINILLNFVKNA